MSDESSESKSTYFSSHSQYLWLEMSKMYNNIIWIWSSTQVSFRAGQRTGSDIRAEHQKAIFTWLNTNLSHSIARNSLQHYALVHQQIHSELLSPTKANLLVCCHSGICWWALLIYKSKAEADPKNQFGISLYSRIAFLLLLLCIISLRLPLLFEKTLMYGSLSVSPINYHPRISRYAIIRVQAIIIDGIIIRAWILPSWNTPFLNETFWNAPRHHYFGKDILLSIDIKRSLWFQRCVLFKVSYSSACSKKCRNYF